ncbi:AAA ATPase domain containing protein [Pandoravirus quercus]|uniref:AAA ATPase domain containing protein n=1 Tax=Pandoravirus quercus TaxID=2107709 RepID=A0A2U7U8B2_9VIRU|nr:AAA ATPase domain containing protein [Pandoravirus quercus]AVK74632.1 AAA ATPase domain containing protein [Pandoravirus quercus]
MRDTPMHDLDDGTPMTPLDLLLSGGTPTPPASAVVTVAPTTDQQRGPAIILRCGSTTADEVARYAAHLLIEGTAGDPDVDGTEPVRSRTACGHDHRDDVNDDGDRADIGLRGSTGGGVDGGGTGQRDGWTTRRSRLRIEAVGPSRDANDKRVTLFQPDAGIWRFVDPEGRRLALDVTINAAKPVSSECDPRLYWEAVLTYHGRDPTWSPSSPFKDGDLDDDADDDHNGEEDGRAALDAFMAAAHKYGEPKVVDRITIRRWTGTHWMRHSRPTKRPLDTLFLPADTVRGVVDDLTDFLGGEADYARFGRPYKRVYLLSGAPGLGKSSLALALAGHFDMDLYVYAIDDESTDQGLGAAVSAADAPCVLLIEDVDAAGAGGKSHLTLSGLTNVLDGAQTRHGVAVFLTTNYPDRLDAALTRSGRVDKWLRFDAATADQITAMVKHYFASQFASDPVRSRPTAPSSSSTSVGGEHVDTPNGQKNVVGKDNAVERRDKALARIAETLARRRISAAALSEFLFDHRRSEDIVADLVACAKTIGRRAATPSPRAPGGIDGCRDDVDVTSMYC